MINLQHKLILLILFSVMLIACTEDVDPVVIEKDETPFVLDYGNFPEPVLPADNPLTEQGVELGRMLFYETMLSKDGSQSCASCHNLSDGFSDTLQFSIGVEKMEGKRQAMPIFNMAYHTNDFFWDGRAELLRDQSLKPIEDPLEMNETLENIVAKLSDTPLYKDQFTRVFGSDEITSEKMSLAMEQFMLSVISKDSKYDKFLAGELSLTESEERGRMLFETEYNPFFPEFSGADCLHCHSGFNFENDEYMNNGLDTDADITDTGREKVTMNPMDRAKFKVPSLRNIEVTPPYMHDGRFNTLEEVVDHYNSGIKLSASLDPAIRNTEETGLFLTEQDKADLVNFLKTLTDETFLNNNAYKSPF